jgi:DNA-directed RNA polymerase sigma subunit (sigma70/sigma32)
MAEEDLVRVERAAQRVEKLSDELDRARDNLRVAVAAAHDKGETISELARRLGVSRQRVYQLLR